MPLWAAIAVGAGVFLLLAGLAVGGYFGWRLYTKRSLTQLVGRAEAIDSATSALVDALTRLAATPDEELELFAYDPESGERRVLHEVATRSRLLADELDTMPLPRPLVAVAEALADAAFVVGDEAGRVSDDVAGAEALDELGRVDLARARAYVRQARSKLGLVCEHYGVVDTVVYGGGLYL